MSAPPPRSAPARSQVRRLLSVVRPHTTKLAVASVMGIVSVGTAIAIPLVTRTLVDEAVVNGRRGLVAPLAAAVFALGAFRSLSNFLRRNLSGLVSVDVEADLRARLFAHLQGLPISFHDQWQTGQLLARATGDLNVIRMFVGFALVFLAYIVMTVGAVAAVLFVLSPPLALVAVILTVPYAIVAIRFNHRMEDVAARSREWAGEVTSAVEESAGGVRVLKAFGREGLAVDRVERSSRQLRDTNLEAVGLRARHIPLLALIPNVLLGAMLGIGGWQVIDGSLSLGSLVAFNQYLALIVWPLRHVGWILSSAQQASAAAARVFEVLDTQPEIVDSPDAVALPPLDGEISFERVTFAYPGSTRAALDGVEFTVQPGETIALVGATGSGKSTIASLIPRFADPSDGRILVDGHDIRAVTIRSLRRQIGVVFDEPVLFSASIRDNIAFGAPEASMHDVERAALAAGAHEFIARLPYGYDTRVGESGLSLSGGQRQRLALARALLFHPRILILDDPLSSVDVKTEAAIEERLRALLVGRTTVLISHRASTIAMADRVLLVDDGRIVATGTHAELLRFNDAYRRVLAADLEGGAAAVTASGAAP